MFYVSTRTIRLKRIFCCRIDEMPRSLLFSRFPIRRYHRDYRFTRTVIRGLQATRSDEFSHYHFSWRLPACTAASRVGCEIAFVAQPLCPRENHPRCSPERFADAIFEVQKIASEKGRQKDNWLHGLQIWVGFDDETEIEKVSEVCRLIRMEVE